MADYKDKSGKDLKLGTKVLVPCVVIKLAGVNSQLVQLETEEAYGHENPDVKGPFKGRTKTALWVEPQQIEAVAE